MQRTQLFDSWIEKSKDVKIQRIKQQFTVLCPNIELFTNFGLITVLLRSLFARTN